MTVSPHRRVFCQQCGTTSRTTDMRHSNACECPPGIEVWIVPITAIVDGAEVRVTPAFLFTPDSDDLGEAS